MHNTKTFNSSLLIWCFDKRFDILLKEYLDFTRHKQQPYSNVMLVRTYKTEYDNDNTFVYLYILPKNINGIVQEEPETVNRLLTLYLAKIFGLHLSEIEIKTLQRYTFEFTGKDTLQVLLSNKKNNSAITIHSFTNYGLKQSPYYNIQNSSPDISEFWNSKINQFTVLSHYNLPLPEHSFCENIDVFLSRKQTYSAKLGDFLLIPENSAGGYNITHIPELSNSKSDSYINKKISSYDKSTKFLLSKHMNNYNLSVSCQCCITQSAEIYPFLCTRMLLKKFKYIGLALPSSLPQATERSILTLTARIGEILKESGYHGFFGVDYIVSEDMNILITEVNARYTFTTLLYTKNYFRDNIFALMADNGDWGNIRKTPENSSCILKKLEINELHEFTEFTADVTTNLEEFTARSEIILFDKYWSNQNNLNYGSYYGLYGIKG